MTRRTWYLVTNSLVGAWLALAVVAVTAHRFVPNSNWLMVRLLLLGALSTAIYIWSQHFADSLLRRKPPGGRRSLGLRLILHTLGAGIVVAGMMAALWPLLLAGAVLVVVAAVIHGLTLAAQLRGVLPARFASLVWYYVAATLTLVVGVTLGVIMARPGMAGAVHDRLFVAHLGMNLLGWVGLTVIGTSV